MLPCTTQPPGAPADIRGDCRGVHDLQGFAVSAQAFLTNQYLAVVMEHTPGGNLLDYITNNSPDVPGVGLHEEIAR